MNNERLTAFDNFILGKNKYLPQDEQAFSEEAVIFDDSQNLSTSYTTYLKEQLRRTQPSDRKVLTQEEFETQDGEETVKARMWQALGGRTNSAAVIEEKNTKFKKFGKIILCAYVIIMLCLALIVIVKTTTGERIESADASDEPQAASCIEIMQEEEEENSNNWFDNLCDSLNFAKRG